MTKAEMLKEARRLAKERGCTLETQNMTINGSQAYKIVDEDTGITRLCDMTLMSAWEVLSYGKFYYEDAKRWKNFWRGCKMNNELKSDK